MNIPFLNDVITIFLLSIGVVFLSSKLRIPTIVGFMITGILAGPHGFKLVNDIAGVNVLSEIGVALLLFTIGIEFSFKNLFHLKKPALLGGGIQVILTTAVVTFTLTLLKLNFTTSLFIGCLTSLSSTAIVLKILQEKAETDSPHGSTALAILIFQDIIVIPLIIFTPFLSGTTTADTPLLSALSLLITSIVILAAVILGARYAIPYVLLQIVRTRNRELFILSTITICFAVAWLTHSAGLSIAIGAFLAGIIISESEYSHQILGNVLPLRDVFSSFFFISVGMLLNTTQLFSQLPLILLILMAVIILKISISTFAAIILGHSLRSALLTGLYIFQVGEFSFILSRAGLDYTILSPELYNIFLAVTVLTMALTPFIADLAPSIASTFLRLPLPPRIKHGLFPTGDLKGSKKPAALQDHLLIIGYGITGRSIARAAKIANIQYIALEMNPEVVKTESANGEPVYYGDATYDHVLHFVNANHAKVVVIATSDPAATQRITSNIRTINSKAQIIVRALHLDGIEQLRKLGADEVVVEDYEASVEIFARVLERYFIPQSDIEQFVSDLRSDGYDMIRKLSKPLKDNLDAAKLQLPGVEINTYRVHLGAKITGKTLAEIDLRKKYGITLLALRRGDKIISNPESGLSINTDDILILMGNDDDLANVQQIFSVENNGK